MDIGTLLDPFSVLHVPVGDIANDGIRWLTGNFRDVFRAAKVPVKVLLDLIEDGLRGAPQTLVIVLLSLIAWQVVNRGVALITLLAMIAIGLIGAWDAAMTSLAVLTSAVLIATVFGLPLGIMCSRSKVAWAMARPVLDFMQTVPSFTYLVPVILLFGIGNVPGVIVTAFFAMPPLVRLTNLALRGVRADLVEAANAFGAPPFKRLWSIELPLARPTIMAGLNQTVMMSLAMSVIASMISVAGLGKLVLVGISQLDMARAATGGIGIVLLAVVFDRITQGFGLTRRDRAGKGLWEQGPVGHLRRAFSGATSRKTKNI